MELRKYQALLRDQPSWGELATFVPNKRLPVYNWFYYKEGFARDLVWQLLDLFRVAPGEKVLDPFCGSGTTLLACKQRGVNAVGVDSLGMAVLASIVKTADYQPGELREQAEELFRQPFRAGPVPKGEHARFFAKPLLQDIIFFREEVEEIADPQVKGFFLLGLITAGIQCSYAWKDGTMLKVRKHPVPPFRKFYQRRVKDMIKDMETAPAGAGKIMVGRGDARTLEFADNSFAAAITSPPYLNQVDYGRVYRLEEWMLGWGVEGQQYVGASAEQDYFQDMGRALQEMHRVLRPGGRAAVVVASSYFPQEDRIVESDLLLARAAEGIGFHVPEILVLNKRFALQHRSIQRGVLRESLLILEKPRERS
ncbi:MAG: hypothetical protein HY520_04300 [Candidatus Aenigmarchaeota archaeon]|nr:hypothetical protein [Candidatus Aenigmarchaeota archaeon]